MRHLRGLAGVILAGLAVALVGAHLFAFRLVSSRLGLPVAAAGVLAMLAVATHAGALSRLSGWLRRRFHSGGE